jgi:ABC-type branched-subunit amino acid transport system ATPase component
MLVVEDLAVYYEESCILSQVSLDVAPGRVSCLLGRNGVGKTTLLKAIMGVLKPRRGKVTERQGARGDRLCAAGARDLPVPDGAREPAHGLRGEERFDA